MATTSNLLRLLRAAVSHHNATTLLHPHHHTSPTFFLHSHPSNFPISNPHLFSSFLSRCVLTRATALQNPQNPVSIIDPSNLLISNPHLFSTSISRRVHTRATALPNPRSPYSIWPYALTLGCIATGGMIVFYEFREKKSVPELNGCVNDELEFRFQCSIPHLYRKGHSVVVEGLFRPITDNINSNAAANNDTTEMRGWEYNLLATEVLAQPQEVAPALERNKNIFAEKQKVWVDKEQYVPDDEEIISEEEEQKDAVDWYKTPSDKISESAVDLSKSKSEGRVDQLSLAPKFVFTTADVLKDILDTFEDIPELLREGHSVFIKGFIKRTTDEIKEDKSDVMKEDKSDVMKKEDASDDMREDDQSLEDKSDEIKVGESDEMKVNESDEIKEDKLDVMKEAKWTKSVTGKTKKIEYHVSAEAIAKHDERYMPEEVAAAIGWNIAE